MWKKGGSGKMMCKQVTEHCCKVMEIGGKVLRKNSIEYYQLWST